MGSKITADGDCSQEIKRCLFLGRKAMANLKSKLKSRDITLPTKVRLVKAMDFPVVKYGFKSWTIKNTEHMLLNLMLEKTLESPLDCKEIQRVHPKGNQSWIFIGTTDAEAETPILSPDVKNWLTHWKRPWYWERLKAGREGDNRGWDGWMASPTRWTWVWTRSRSRLLTGKPGMLQSLGSQTVGHDWETSLSLSCTGEGNGNPLQCSCLENPRDGGAWWAAVYGVAQSWAQLKWLSSSKHTPTILRKFIHKLGVFLFLSRI